MAVCASDAGVAEALVEDVDAGSVGGDAVRPGGMVARTDRPDSSQQAVAEGIERSQLALGADDVQIHHCVGDGHGVPVVPERPFATVETVGAEQDLEQVAGPVEPAPGAPQQVGLAHLGGGGARQLGVEAAAEDADKRPQLVVGMAAVAVDEGAGDAVGLDRHVARQVSIGSDVGHVGRI